MIRTLLGLACAGTIAACTPIAPVKTIALSGGEVTATAPDGYCVDEQSSRPASGFAVLAPCTTLGVKSPGPAVTGVATVQVGAPDSGDAMNDETALEEFLTSDAGSALLSQTGVTEEITILSSQAINNEVTVHFLDAGTPPLQGLQGEEWRAFIQTNGRLVTIAVRGLAQAPLRDGPGSGLLALMMTGVKAAIPDSGPAT